MSASKPSEQYLVIFLVLAAVLVMPIVVYIWHFSLEISTDHQRWGEMGAAMGGIYSPIVGMLTVWLLWQQHQTLKAQHIAQTQQDGRITELQESQQSFMQEQHLQSGALKQMQLIISKIQAKLNDPACARTMEIYEKFDVSDLASELLTGHSTNSDTEQLAVLWQSAYANFSVFNTHGDVISQIFYESMKQMLVIELTYLSCRTLDRIAALQRKFDGPFEFELYLNTLHRTKITPA